MSKRITKLKSSAKIAGREWDTSDDPPAWWQIRQAIGVLEDLVRDGEHHRFGPSDSRYALAIIAKAHGYGLF